MNIVDLIPELSQDQNKYKVHFAIGYKGVPKKKPLYLFIKDEFQEWQNEQNDRNFERDYILSFVYFEKDEWLFVGVYKRISLKQIGKRNFKYKTELTNIGSELIGRLIIKYAKNYRATYVTFERYSKYFELL